MPTLADQVRRRAHVYVRHGGKANRRQQVERLVAVVEWIEARERLTGLDQIGKRHIVDFWKNHRDLAERTAYGYWLALRELWTWLDRPGEPPRPRSSSEPPENHGIPSLSRNA